MSARHRLGAAALLVGALGALGCPRPPAASDSTATPAVGDMAAGLDTARGVVMIVGNEPMATLVLQPAPTRAGDASAELLALGGDSTALLRAVTGLEVTVAGRRTGERVVAAGPRGATLFRVERFVVRAHDGTEAHDGVLVARDGGHWLRAADGREARVAALPPALQAQLGARVFLVGPLDRAPQAWGVIATAR